MQVKVNLKIMHKILVNWLTKMPENCFSSMLLKLGSPFRKDARPRPQDLCALWDTFWVSLSLFHSQSLLCAASPTNVFFFLFVQSLAGLRCWAEVASLLCVNSALIQELFYAVKGTCDREEEGRRWEKQLLAPNYVVLFQKQSFHNCW